MAIPSFFLRALVSSRGHRRQLEALRAHLETTGARNPLLIGVGHHLDYLEEMLKILGDLKAKGVKRVGLELYPTHSGAATRGLVVSDGDTTFFHALQRRGEELGLEVIPLDNAKRYREEFDDHVKAKWRKRTPTGIIAQTLRIPFNLQRLVEGLSVQTAAKFSGNAHMIEEILRNKLNEPGCAVLCGEGHGQTIARLMPEFTHFDLHPLRAWARLVDAPTTWQSHRLTRKRLERKKLIGPAHKR